MLRLFLLLVVTLTCPSLQAASIAHTIDTERTTIKLSWRAFGGIPSWAHLKGVTGKVILNPENEFDDHINVTVPVATLQASIACRERRSPCMPLPPSHDRPIRWIVLRWWWTIASPLLSISRQNPPPPCNNARKEMYSGVS